jgi:hypothetical protein
MLNLGMGMLLETGTDIAGNKIAVNKLHGINNEHVVISDTDIDPDINVGKYGTDIESSFANGGIGESGIKTDYNVLNTSLADDVNKIFKDTMGYEPPYKPGTMVTEIELTENTTFVRVYDKTNSSTYSWCIYFIFTWGIYCSIRY